MSKDFRAMPEIARDIRKELKAAYPEIKFSVSCGRGSRSLNIAVMETPYHVFASPNHVSERPDMGPQSRNNTDYAQLNSHYITQFTDWNTGKTVWGSNGYHLNEQAAKMLQHVVEIANRRNWNNSDIQSDYFDVNYYLFISIGKFDKPFTVKY